jgi:hypothetical protein
MRPTQHPSSTRVLGAPKGWDQQVLPCGALAITDVVHAGVPHVISFWRPDTEELARLNAGGTVAIWITGNTMPPISVVAEPAV